MTIIGARSPDGSVCYVSESGYATDPGDAMDCPLKGEPARTLALRLLDQTAYAFGNPLTHYVTTRSEERDRLSALLN